jgi:3-oxo-5-alpha-steroid 4-dehydrogenase 1
MLINWQSDNIVRNLRKPGDTNHYLPEKGLFAYVTSANYFGEIVEWIGFAILTWSWSGAVFAWWTAANLVPRANTLYHKYQTMFGAEQMGKRKRIFPFIY